MVGEGVTGKRCWSGVRRRNTWGKVRKKQPPKAFKDEEDHAQDQDEGKGAMEDAEPSSKRRKTD